MIRRELFPLLLALGGIVAIVPAPARAATTLVASTRPAAAGPAQVSRFDPTDLGGNGAPR